MKYIVERLSCINLWIKDNEYPEERYAIARCYELAGNDCYTEPSRELSKGYFGTKQVDEPWICRIIVEK